MNAYKIVGNKAHRRPTRIDQPVTYPDGSTGMLHQAGPMTVYPVGTILDDVTPGELAAFPDKFLAASAQEVEAFKAKQEELVQAMVNVNAEEVADKAQQRAKLRDRIAELQSKLAELGPEDAGTMLREHAPVDPVTEERFEREQVALRQVATEQQRREREDDARTPKTGRIPETARTEREERKDAMREAADRAAANKKETEAVTASAERHASERQAAERATAAATTLPKP